MTWPASLALPGRSFEVVGDGDPRGMVTALPREGTTQGELVDAAEALDVEQPQEQ